MKPKYRDLAMCYRLITLIIAFLANYIEVFPQQVPQIILQTPDAAAAIQRNFEIPISKNTGRTALNIPLYTIEIKGLKIPISLSYTGSGGIKTDEEATIVGLGWRLDVGGYLSRTMEGKPDENAFFEKQTINEFLSYPSIDTDPQQTQRRNFMKEVKDINVLEKDLMPDQFFYSAGGYSGKFMYKQDASKFVFFPREDCHVSYKRNPALQSKDLLSWDLYTPQGNKYTFGEDGRNSSRILRPTDLDPSSSFNVTDVYNLWNLKRIKTIYNEQVEYSYDTYSYQVYGRSTGDLFSIFSRTYQKVNSRESSQISEGILRSITFPNGSIYFLNSGREDTPSRKIEEITVKNGSGEILKKIKFYYSYFNGSVGTVTSNLAHPKGVQYDNKRLKLDSLSILSADNEKAETYLFSYYDNNGILPSKYSYSQDIWGYFNGALNTTWVPMLNQDISNGADRKVNANFSNVFMLKEICYPTGGTKLFDYESNEVYITDYSELTNYLNEASPSDRVETLRLSGLSPNFQSGGEKYYYKEFTIGENGGFPTSAGWEYAFGASLSNAPSNSGCTLNYAIFKLEKRNDSNGQYTALYHQKYCNQQGGIPADRIPQVSLTKGTYRLTIVTNFPTVPDVSLSGLFTRITVRDRSQLSNFTVKIGGLRIKQIRTFDRGILIENTMFDYRDDNGFSSGYMYMQPQFIQYRYGSLLEKFAYGTPIRSNKEIGGGLVGYKKIMETKVSVNGDSLKTKYTYSYKPITYDSYMFPESNLNGLNEPQVWQFGKLISEEAYRSNIPISKVTYDYGGVILTPSEDSVEEINSDYISLHTLNIPGYGRDFTDNHYFENSLGPIISPRFIYGIPFVDLQGNNGSMTSGFKLPFTKKYTAVDKLLSKKVEYYFPNNTSLVEVNNYYYGGGNVHTQITGTETVSSNGTNSKSKLYYPVDFAQELVYQNMKMNNMVDNIIRQEYWDGNKLLKTEQTAYADYSNGLLLPEQLTTVFSNGAEKKKVSYNKYGLNGNPIEIEESTGLKVVYLWGYGAQYPVVEIKNAAYAEVAAVLTQAAIDNLTVSTHAEATMETLITNAAAKLRNSLPQAMVSSYTYRPLVGMTSKTDTRGVKETYTYDGMQRLQAILDHLNYVNKSFDYHYRPK